MTVSEAVGDAAAGSGIAGCAVTDTVTAEVAFAGSGPPMRAAGSSKAWVASPSVRPGVSSGSEIA